MRFTIDCLSFTLGILLASNLAFAQWAGTDPVTFIPTGSGGKADGSSITNGVLISCSSSGTSLNIGVDAAGPQYSWVQARSRHSQLMMNLSLNPWGGNVGVGTTTPAAKFHIKDGSGGNQLSLSRGTGRVTFVQGMDQDNLQLYNGDFSKVYMSWSSNGFVGIGTGTQTPDARLTVKGTVHAEEVKVDLNVPAPDYVFGEDYKLLSLSEVAAYIRQNKHLPEIPSAKAMEENGIDLGEMNMLLLKKVEELTLYMIELKQEIEILRSEKE